MNTKHAVAERIVALCAERNLTPNALATLAGIPPMTLYGILGEKSQNPGIVTIKKLCDALEITLSEFFSTTEFDQLEQEIR